MKNFSRFSVLALGLVTLAGSAGAVDFPTNAQVEIVEGIVITENTPLNFGVLALKDGTVEVDADGTATDGNNMIFDNSAVAAGDFGVQSVDGSTLQASATAGTPPSGITLADFDFAWDGSAGDNVTLSGSDTANLTVGANLTIDANNASAGGGTQDVPYTLSVVFQ
jgi:hypothetical protein